jgi:hypothetical protein
VTFQAKAPHKKRRWLALLAVVMLGTGAAATTVLAAPSFTFTNDDQGANDEPGQKDLTAQGQANDPVAPNHFFTAWKWDDTAWSGKNTGDGCSLFDTDAVKNGFVDYAICATIGGKTPALLAVRVYSCGDNRVDRCTSPVLRLTSATGCTITGVTGAFDANDTQATCDITALAAASSPPISDLTGGTLLNTCSYPSQEPNSDPSDCVLTPGAQNTSVTTLSSGTTSWSATLNDTATLNPTTSTGTVVFKLWSDASCTVLVWTSPSISVTASGTATTAGGGTPTNGNTVSTAGTYSWTSDFTPSGLFNASSSSCGEATTVTAPSVSGSAG